jgi:general secretion pathway protein K
MQMGDNSRGMALIVTLAVVAVILTGALAMNRLAGDAAVQAHRTGSQFLSMEKAMSGIHLGMAVLVQDARISAADSIQEDWADPEKLAIAAAGLGFDPDSLSIVIDDEMGKIQMNALIKEYPGHEYNQDQKLIWERFLALYGIAEESSHQMDVDPVMNCAKDWLDSNDDGAVTGLSGAESDEYSQDRFPYTCANGPFVHPNELFLLRGVSPPLLSDQEDSYMDVTDFFTVYGIDDTKNDRGKFFYSGRINLNTAPVEVISALLPDGMDPRASDLADYRAQKGSQGDVFLNPLDKGWYKRVIDLSEKETKDLDRVVKYSSHIFSITSTGGLGRDRVTLRAVVLRENINGWTCRILQLERKG